MFEDAPRLAVFYDLADDPEVLPYVRRREALHELRRLAQLDLEHDRQVAVGPEPLQVESCNAAKAGLRVEPFEGGSALRDSGLHGLLED